MRITVFGIGHGPKQRAARGVDLRMIDGCELLCLQPDGRELPPDAATDSSEDQQIQTPIAGLEPPPDAATDPSEEKEKKEGKIYHFFISNPESVVSATGVTIFVLPGEPYPETPEFWKCFHSQNHARRDQYGIFSHYLKAIDFSRNLPTPSDWYVFRCEAIQQDVVKAASQTDSSVGEASINAWKENLTRRFNPLRYWLDALANLVGTGAKVLIVSGSDAPEVAEALAMQLHYRRFPEPVYACALGICDPDYILADDFNWPPRAIQPTGNSTFVQMVDTTRVKSGQLPHLGPLIMDVADLLTFDRGDAIHPECDCGEDSNFESEQFEYPSGTETFQAACSVFNEGCGYRPLAFDENGECCAFSFHDSHNVTGYVIPSALMCNEIVDRYWPDALKSVISLLGVMNLNIVAGTSWEDVTLTFHLRESDQQFAIERIVLQFKGKSVDLGGDDVARFRDSRSVQQPLKEAFETPLFFYAKGDTEKSDKTLVKVKKRLRLGEDYPRENAKKTAKSELQIKLREISALADTLKIGNPFRDSRDSNRESRVNLRVVFSESSASVE